MSDARYLEEIESCSRRWGPIRSEQAFGAVELFVPDAYVRRLHPEGPSPRRELLFARGVKQVRSARRHELSFPRVRRYVDKVRARDDAVLDSAGRGVKQSRVQDVCAGEFEEHFGDL